MTLPYPFQLADVRRVHKLGGRVLCAWEMGLGKTFLALLYLRRHPEALPAVVVCPASLKYNWEREAAHHVGLRAEVLEGTKPPHPGLWTPGRLVVVNYDILGPWLPRLLALKPRLVVVDEAHYIAGRSTRRARNVKALCADVPRVLALTGTPLVNRPAELFATLHLLWPRAFPSFWPFGMRYCGGKRNPWGWEFKGQSHADELNAKLLELGMLRRRKADVLDQLPAKRRTVTPVALAGRKEYDHAVADFLGWLATKDAARARRAGAAEKVTRLGYLKRLVGELKLPAVFAWVDDWLAGGDGKLVLFGVHQKVLRPLYERYRRTAVLVDGSVTGRKRQRAVDKFQHHAGTRLFVGNVRAAGVGLTLTASSTVAFAELDFVSGVHRQAEDRVHRIGTKRAVEVVYLVARDTIEEHLCRLLQAKQQVIDRVLDGAADGAGELDVYDKLAEALKGQTKGTEK